MRLSPKAKTLLTWGLAFACAGLLLWWAFSEYTARLYGTERAYDALIREEARRHGLPPELIKAVIWKESRFKKNAVGKALEKGLMQVTPLAGQEWADAHGVENFKDTDLFAPRTCIQAGTWYLARAIKRWEKADKPVIFALAEYNAGRTHARRWAQDLDPWVGAAFIDKIDFPTTKRYILDILEKKNYYLTHPEPPLLELIMLDIQNQWMSDPNN